MSRSLPRPTCSSASSEPQRCPRQSSSACAGRTGHIVAPSVAKANFLALGAELGVHARAAVAHCSVQDGVFVPSVIRSPTSVHRYQRSRTNGSCAGAPVVAAARPPGHHVIDVKLGCVDPRTASRNSRRPERDATLVPSRGHEAAAAVAHKIKAPARRPASCSTRPPSGGASRPGLGDLAGVNDKLAPARPRCSQDTVLAVAASGRCGAAADPHVSADGRVNAKPAPSYSGRARTRSLRAVPSSRLRRQRRSSHRSGTRLIVAGRHPCRG